MTHLMGASGAESLNVAASIFMGQTEAPLTVRPFLNKMTQSELMCVMTAGMAHVSGSIMAAYIAFGVEAKHLLAAVIMTAPGTILLAKMLVPETGTPETAGTVKLDDQRADANVIGAAARGTSDGLHLALNVAAMLISFLSLVALVNLLLGKLGRPGRRPAEPRGDPGLRVHAAGARDGRAVEGRLRDRRPARDAHGAERADRVLAARSHEGDARPAHASRSPPTRSAASPTSARSASRSAASARSLPSGAATWRGSGLRALLAGTFANFLTACIAGVLL